MKMKILTLISVIVTYSSVCLSQSYSLSAFQGEYTELDNYSSLQLENLGDIQLGKRFDLNFMFPYFELEYDHMELNQIGLISFDNEVDFSIRLLTFGYNWDSVLDPNDIPSDIRYADTVINDLKTVIIQFTHMRLFSDTSIEEYDSHINFQYWLYEDGTIELKIGPHELSNSPVYVPGEGFFLHNNQGPIRIGPELGLYHPTDTSIRITYEDFEDHTKYTLRDDALGQVDWMPPSGWVIRFDNLIVNTVEPSIVSKTKIFPNPVLNHFAVSSDLVISTIDIFDTQGSLVIQSFNIDNVDVTELPSGVYFCKLISKNTVETHKILKL